MPLSRIPPSLASSRIHNAAKLVSLPFPPKEDRDQFLVAKHFKQQSTIELCKGRIQPKRAVWITGREKVGGFDCDGEREEGIARERR